MTGLSRPSAGAATVFRRIGSEGWLALAGSVPESSVSPGWLDRLLAHLDLGRPAAWLTLESDDVEPAEFLDDLEDTLMTSIAIVTPSDADWEDSGLLLVGDSGGGPTMGLAPRLRTCLDLGGVIIAMGDTGMAFGEVFISSDGGPVQPGLAWLPGGLILAGAGDRPVEESVRGWLQSPEKRYALRLPPGSVFAIGPGSEAEVWGGPPPGIILGAGWTHT